MAESEFDAGSNLLSTNLIPKNYLENNHLESESEIDFSILKMKQELKKKP